ncbi:unnamed protein product [Orchesella dallaii]|uniref:Cadherin domain-containing protein n=1 Tax=Orchesella dallaii TaxID=48710 RepID=A0ABP1RQC6_9HEXA
MYNETTYFVDELESTYKEILTIEATDEDHPVKYGNVSYLIVDDGHEGDDNNGMGKFRISIQGGVLTAVPNAYNWNITKEYRVQIKAVDYYRPTQSSGSNPTVMFLYIRVNDQNNNRPEFLTYQGGIDNPLVELKERDPVPNQPFDETIILRDWDNSELDNGKVLVEILKVVKEKDGEEIEDPEFMELFELGELVENKAEYQWELPIIPLKNFTGLWGAYTITIKASNGPYSDPPLAPCEGKYVIKILNENLNAPEFAYPADNTTSIYLSIDDSKEFEILIDLKTNLSVPNVLATDPDDGENGVVLYDLENHDETIDCRDHFKIHPYTGRIKLKQRFTSDDAGNHCLLLVKAYDRGDEPKTSYRTMDFLLLTESNTPPAFSVATLNVPISENDTAAYASISHATDFDIETDENPLYDDVIYYFIKGGAIDVFDLEETESEDENGRPIRIPALRPKEVLDREEIDEYLVTIYATNNIRGDEVDIVNPEDVDPNNKQFLVVTVEVTDVKDTFPAFATEEIITGGFSTIRKTDEIITIVSVIDPDLDDPISFEITSGFTPSDSSLPTTLDPFALFNTNNNTVEIMLKFDPQPNYKGHYRFQITATDTVGFSASTMCQMYMVTNENILKIYFFNPREFFTQERQTTLAKILSDSFSSRCKIDRVIVDTTGIGTTVVETHFIDVSTNEPVASSYIQDQQYRPDVFSKITTQLSGEGFLLTPNGIGGPS